MLGVVQDWMLLLTGVTALLLWFLPCDPVCEN
jgi:hypothetical protein